jgi:SAM-dependent methyltransferase
VNPAVGDNDREDFEFLLETARLARKRQIDHFLHLDQPVGIWNYIRIANEIAATVPRGRLLDWGCGFGQMTWLLRRRGFDVTAYDIAETTENLPDLPLTRAVEVVRSTTPATLPFESRSFDAVLSCGVLEHVDEYSKPGNEWKALLEIHRVLRPGGYFPIYQLPQEHTWQEAITRRLRIGYSHPRRFTEREIRDLLTRAGYGVEWLRRNNMLPKNLTGMPGAVRNVYSRFSHLVISVDRLISSIPVVNRVAGVIEVMARKH